MDSALVAGIASLVGIILTYWLGILREERATKRAHIERREVADEIERVARDLAEKTRLVQQEAALTTLRRQDEITQEAARTRALIVEFSAQSGRAAAKNERQQQEIHTLVNSSAERQRQEIEVLKAELLALSRRLNEVTGGEEGLASKEGEP